MGTAISMHRLQNGKQVCWRMSVKQQLTLANWTSFAIAKPCGMDGRVAAEDMEKTSCSKLHVTRKQSMKWNKTETIHEGETRQSWHTTLPQQVTHAALVSADLRSSLLHLQTQRKVDQAMGGQWRCTTSKCCPNYHDCYMQQSRVEIEYYSVAYFERITKFDVL